MDLNNSKLWKKLISLRKSRLNEIGCKVWFVETVPIKGADGICSEDKIIYIDKNCSLIDQYALIIHEGQHLKCLIDKCFCWNRKSDFFTEYHATKSEFIELFDLISIIKILIIANRYAKKYYKNKWIAHLKALRKVLKFKRFKDAAKTNFELRRYNSLLRKLNLYIDKLSKN